MRNFWNGTAVTLWALCVLSALAALGGCVTEYALPMYWCGAAAGGMWALKLLCSSEGSWNRTPLHVCGGLLVGYAVARCFTAELRHEAHAELLQVGLFGLIYFLAAFVFYRPRWRVIIFAVLITVSVLEAVYGYWQHATGTDKVFWFVRPDQYHGRASGTFICPNHLAGWLEMVALVLLAQIVVNPRPLKSLEGSVIAKLLELTALGAVLVGLVASGSRAGWFSLGIGVAGFWLWAWRSRWMPPRVADGILVALLLALVVAWAIPAVRQRCQELLTFRLDYTFDYRAVQIRDASLEGRLAMSLASWRMFLDHFWFGVGPGAWQWFHPQYRLESVTFQPRYAHNDVFQFAAEYGFVGGVLLIGALVCFFWQASVLGRRGRPDSERALAVGSALAVGAMLVHSFFDFNMHIPANGLLLVTLIGLTAGTGDEEAFARRRMSRVAKIVLGVLLLFGSALIAWNAFRLCMAQRHVLAGRAAQAARAWGEAVVSYQRALGLAPHWSEAYARMGEAYRLQGSAVAATNALAAYQRALEWNPRNAAVVLSVALTHETLGDTNKAAAAFQRLFVLDPHNADYWVEYGRFAEKLGRTNEALRAYQKAARASHPEATYLLRRLQNQNR